MKSVFRVSYNENGQPKSAFVCAETSTGAAEQMGIMDGSAQVNAVAYPVEVVGLDPQHKVVEPPAPFKAPPAPPAQVSREEFARLEQTINDLRAKLAVTTTLIPKE